MLNVTDNNEHSIVRYKLRAMKLNELLTRRTIDRLRRWRHDCIRMLAKHDARHHLAGKKRRLRALLSQTLFRVLLREFYLVFRLTGDGDYWRFGSTAGGAYGLQQIRGNALGSPTLDKLDTIAPTAGDRLRCNLTASSISCACWRT